MNNRGDNNNQRRAIILKICIIIFSCIEIVIFVKIYRFIKAIQITYKNCPPSIFENCILYPNIFELIDSIFILIMNFDIIMIFFIPLIDSSEIFILSIDTLLYSNYLIFGPFLIGVVIFILGNINKFLYRCVGPDGIDKTVNIKLTIDLFLYLCISTITFSVGSLHYCYCFFDKSIKFDLIGNYFVGKFFWLHSFNDNENDRNLRNEGNMIQNVGVNRNLLQVQRINLEEGNEFLI